MLDRRFERVGVLRGLLFAVAGCVSSPNRRVMPDYQFELGEVLWRNLTEADQQGNTLFREGSAPSLFVVGVMRFFTGDPHDDDGLLFVGGTPQKCGPSTRGRRPSRMDIALSADSAAGVLFMSQSTAVHPPKRLGWREFSCV